MPRTRWRISAINGREQTQQRASRARVRADSGPWERDDAGKTQAVRSRGMGQREGTRRSWRFAAMRGWMARPTSPRCCERNSRCIHVGRLTIAEPGNVSSRSEFLRRVECGASWAPPHTMGVDHDMEDLPAGAVDCGSADRHADRFQSPEWAPPTRNDQRSGDKGPERIVLSELY